MLCTRDITLIGFFKGANIADYAPISENEALWLINLAKYRAHYSENQDSSFDSFKKFCTNLEGMRFRREKDQTLMDKFANCFRFGIRDGYVEHGSQD